MKQLYLECLSGISGDMFVAALLDLGADEEKLKEVLRTVPADGFHVHISRVKKAGVGACDFDVVLDAELENHDHDMAFLFGNEHDHAHTHEHLHNHEHDHDHDHNHESSENNHDHEHDHEGYEHTHEHAHDHAGDEHTPHEHHHAHAHRGLKEVLQIINGTQMSGQAKKYATDIFTVLGKAEAKAHETTLEEVHFHEVGAVDSIVDIIAAAVCLDDLNVSEVIVPVLYEGTGKIRCQHGILPVPVPAVANIIADSGLPLHITDMHGELVTPTGAAIAAAIRTTDKLPETFAIQKIGIGAGKREYESPSMLRAMLIEANVPQKTEESDCIYKLESNIDDCTGEVFGYVLNLLMEAGARDVNYMPVFMKKNRPGYQLNVICTEDKVKELEGIIFRETTTIGIRKCKMERSILQRESREIETSIGMATVKICTYEGIKKVYPEYDSVTKLANETGKTFAETFALIEQESYGKY